ncbi:hypothetical protein EAJ17_10880 [Akkermansia sp. aa_0143]|nr:hypothetical protein EAJ17_10880 [Akkermansia sp. aa_0143]
MSIRILEKWEKPKLIITVQDWTLKKHIKKLEIIISQCFLQNPRNSTKKFPRKKYLLMSVKKP